MCKKIILALELYIKFTHSFNTFFITHLIGFTWKSRMIVETM